ncbi:MAG: hypothetical protein AEth_00726 [Candidatus Argoarchaeum ethanivorans]|uniref:Restriction endonuclease type IV Mrr domain-containing protein n=1 Tax=Candidatus Argoarchaeum ethanivorans TaxID=2608793 RepID=A0A8B3S329_9EURY|nr:MAG: hypothetical protein AEth_00726 [Candidatus Argoarchaeum ethanivorans]
MAKSGKNFENLVAKIEKAFAGPAEVKQNDYLLDFTTGKKRQVDITIRSKVAEYLILIIVECRDHKKPVGSGYIEEICTKRDCVRADKTVIVSSSGFSKPAIQKAKNFGITLLNIEDANNFPWQNLLPTVITGSNMLHRFKAFFHDFKEDITNLTPAPEYIAFLENPDQETKIFRGGNNERYSLIDIWNKKINLDSAFKQIPVNSGIVERKFCVQFNEKNCIYIKFQEKLVPIEKLYLTVLLSKEEKFSEILDRKVRTSMTNQKPPISYTKAESKHGFFDMDLEVMFKYDSIKVVKKEDSEKEEEKKSRQ